MVGVGQAHYLCARIAGLKRFDLGESRAFLSAMMFGSLGALGPKPWGTAKMASTGHLTPR